MGRYAVVIQSWTFNGVRNVPAEDGYEDIKSEAEAKELCRKLVSEGKEDNTIGIVSVYQGPETNPWKWRELCRLFNKGGTVVDENDMTVIESAESADETGEGAEEPFAG